MRTLMIFSLLLLNAFPAFAKDTKLGSIVAVEREIEDIYASCTRHVRGDVTKPSSQFLCLFSVLEENEFSFTEKFFLREKTSHCFVDASLEKGHIFISFGSPKGPVSYSAAQNCLSTALTNKNSLKFTVYTVE